MDDDEVYDDTWEKENELLLYLKNDVLSTAFFYARYSRGMEESSGVHLKNCSTSPCLADK